MLRPTRLKTRSSLSARAAVLVSLALSMGTGMACALSATSDSTESAAGVAQTGKKPNILVIWATTSGPGTSASTAAG